LAQYWKDGHFVESEDKGIANDYFAEASKSFDYRFNKIKLFNFRRFEQLSLDMSDSNLTVIHGDETPLKVIQEEKTTSYMWVYYCGEDKVNNNKTKNIVLFDYQNSRAAKCPITFLNGYNNFVQVDGYIAYEKTDAIPAGCMAHARRKFIDVKAAQGKNKIGKADVLLNLIGKLYGIEANIKTKSYDEKHRIRQEKSKPIIDKINHWVDDNREKVPPKSKLGEAMTYWHNQAHKLETYLKDERINIDDNRAERAVKPFVIGKNWMFSNTVRCQCQHDTLQFC